MDKADRARRAAARSLADLGELTALWLEGKIMSQPGYCDPDPDEEWGPFPETRALVPVLAAANRAGFLTSTSQPGGSVPGWTQRAAVSGFADNATLARLGAAFAEHPEIYAIITRAPRFLTRHRTASPVTRCGTRDCTSFGARLSQRFIRDSRTGYGECGREAVRAVCDAWQVTLIDTSWGREPSPLWTVLAEFAGAPRAACPWCSGNAWNPAWPECTCRAVCPARACFRCWSVPAADVRPGMDLCRYEIAEPGGAPVVSVTGPDEDGMVTITREGRAPWRLGAADRVVLPASSYQTYRGGGPGTAPAAPVTTGTEPRGPRRGTAA
jgi:hypothetical protein